MLQNIYIVLIIIVVCMVITMAYGVGYFIGEFQGSKKLHDELMEMMKRSIKEADERGKVIKERISKETKEV